MELRRRLIYAVILLLTVTTLSVAGYLWLGGPHVTFLQALYMAVITLAGVGYGEIVDTSHNPMLRVFNMFVVLVGVTITVYVFSSVTAFLVEGEITNIFWRRRMQKRISELKDHYVVCGLGMTGRYAVEELQKTGTPFVIVETHQENIQKLLEHKDLSNLLYIIGDATDDEVLTEAGISRARGLIVALSADKDNLVIIVMVRQMNPKIRIVARCTDPKFSEKMLKAGANSTVSPTHIGGLRMASEMLRPHVVSFLDLMLKEQSRTLRVEEVEVGGASPWVGKTLAQIDLRTAYNLLPMAVKRPSAGDNNYHVNPPDSLTIEKGMILIVIGDVKDLHRVRQEA
ncbi:MAG TPA: potassium channel protein [Terriglobales bacterium]|jgi:voltage-gated potassium channel|nr:potassium channel protein [Terriglobales bacterium]